MVVLGCSKLYHVIRRYILIQNHPVFSFVDDFYHMNRNDLHNEAIRSTMHSTDTHGYTEAVFGLMSLLGFDFAPRIAKLVIVLQTGVKRHMKSPLSLYLYSLTIYMRTPKIKIFYIPIFGSCQKRIFPIKKGV
jgi:hypothetical protein